VFIPTLPFVVKIFPKVFELKFALKTPVAIKLVVVIFVCTAFGIVLEVAEIVPVVKLLETTKFDIVESEL